MSLTLFYNDLIKQVTIVILEEKTMQSDTLTRKDLFKPKGKILKPFNYSFTASDFITQHDYKSFKNRAFTISLCTMLCGLLLPFFIGFISALPYWDTELFEPYMTSNAILALIFCMPLSVVMIAGALPLYRKLMAWFMQKNGFEKIA